MILLQQQMWWPCALCNEFLKCLWVWSSIVLEDVVHCQKCITNFMEHSPSWEANSHSASQEIPHLLWNGSYCVHRSQSLDPILSQINSVHTLPSYFRSDPFYYYPSIYACFFQVVSSLLVFRTKLCMHFIYPINAAYPTDLRLHYWIHW
jgi:hypothetical protein